MRSNLISYILFLVLVVLSSCSSSSKIEVKDGSSLSSSKTDLFQKLDSVYKYRFDNIISYTNRAKIEVNFEGSTYHLNGRVNAVTDKSLKATLSLPFPPVTVGSLDLTSKYMTASSSYANIDVDRSVPEFLLSVANSTIYGAMPIDLLNKHFTLTSIYIKNSRYHLAYSGPYSTVAIFQVDSQYRIAQVSVSSPDFTCELFSSEFQRINKHNLPSNIKVVFTSPKIKGGVTVKSSSIKIY